MSDQQPTPVDPPEQPAVPPPGGEQQAPAEAVPPPPPGWPTVEQPAAAPEPPVAEAPAPVPAPAPPAWPAPGQPVPPPPGAGLYPATTPVPPYTPPPGYGSPPGYGAYPPGAAAVAAPTTSSNAIIALVLSILSWAVCPLVPAIIALVFAANASKEIEASGGRVAGSGLVTAAKIISWINIGLYAAIAVVGGFLFVLFAVASAST